MFTYPNAENDSNSKGIEIVPVLGVGWFFQIYLSSKNYSMISLFVPTFPY